MNDRPTNEEREALIAGDRADAEVPRLDASPRRSA